MLKRRGIYLLPNLFTTAALFFGFYAILVGMDGRFTTAAACIFIAMLLDSLDGRIARITNTQSDFGQQYDSLADLVSFGLAPALVMHQWSLLAMGKLGWLVCFIFATTAALRLARFNVQAANLDKIFFQGLPSPAAGGVVAGTILVGERYGLAPAGVLVTLFSLLITLGAAGLMVSKVRYHSFKQYDLKSRVPFLHIVLVVIVFSLIAIHPPLVLFFLALLYAFSGPVLTLIQMHRRRAGRIRAKSGGQDT